MPAKTRATASVPTKHTVTAVYELIEGEVLPRLKAVEEVAGESHRVLKAAKILNGEGEKLLTKLMVDKSDEEQLREAEAVVAANRARNNAVRAAKRQWLGRPKALAWALALGVASGIGYAIVIHPS